MDHPDQNQLPIMQTRTHIREEVFDASLEEVFSLLIRPSAIRQWWGATREIVLAEKDGTWAATWGDDEDEPDYITVARISKFEPPHLLELNDYRYATREGDLPFEASFTTRFSCKETAGGVVLRVEQAGFPVDQEEFYQACVTGWSNTFAGIRRFLTGQE